MKKIIFSTYDDIKNPHYGGGGAIAIHQVAKYLKQSYDIEVISWNHSGVAEETIDGVPYRRIGHKMLSPKLGMLVYQLILPYVVFRKKFSYWFESFSPPFTTSLLPLFTNKKIVGVVHMLAAEDMQRKYPFFPFGIVENFGISLYKNIITTSEFVKSKIKTKHPKANVVVIENGIEKIEKQNSKKTKTLLYIGRIEIDQKGLDLLLQSFSIFISKYSTEYKLVIAGSGQGHELKALQKLIRQSNLKKYVILKGWVENKQKENLIKRAQAVLIPSRFETFSMVALEAMGYGVPIVHFDIDGMKWVKKDAGIKVKKYSINHFADAMKEITINSTFQKKAAKFSPDYARQFTWEKIAQRYKTYIENNYE